MEIYVVQPGDTLSSIANKYGITTEKLISDNGLINPNSLVIGQAIVILQPQKTYIVKANDTLSSIADINGITVMELYRNNPLLYNREFIYPGESIVIKYNTQMDILVNGYTYSFINLDILKRTLPYLTYVSIFNYRIMENASIISYGDDTEIIKTAKDYQTLPLLMISAFSPTGELNLDIVYDLLLNEDKQDRVVNGMLNIVKEKGFSGINVLFSNLNESNQKLYLNVLTKLSNALRSEGYLLLLTLDPHLNKMDDIKSYQNIDFESISKLVDRIIFLQNVWGLNKQPPSPISNISLIKSLIEYVTSIISSKYLSIGKPIIGYDWSLPFVPNSSLANSMSYDSVIALAAEQRAVIQLDEESQTPFFEYVKSYVGSPENHIIWFIDARSIKALDDVIIKYKIAGSGIWNITNLNQQLLSIINATYNITKISE